MAKFTYQKSELASALDRLQGFAENLISFETNRRIQLGREKEARMVDAYTYMLGKENEKIADLELGLDSIIQNLEDRGVERIKLGPEHKSVEFEALLSAASEGAMELLNVEIQDAQAYREKLEGNVREAKKIKRHIDMFDDAVSLVDPAYSGDKNIIEAEDVAKVALQWMEANDQEGPAIIQRLEQLQTEGELERLQTDYYARLAREAEEKITAAGTGQTEAKIKIETLEPIKKEAQEAVKALTYQPISKMVEEYGFIISRQADIEAGVDSRTGKDLTTTDTQNMQAEIVQEQLRLGSILFPWSYSQDQASAEAQGIQTALTKAVKNGDYYDLVNYFKKGNAQYKLLLQQGNTLAETYRADIQAMFGIDIASDDWVSQLIELNEISARIDIEQATEAVKIGRELLPEIEEPGSDKDPIMEKYGFE